MQRILARAEGSRKTPSRVRTSPQTKAATVATNARLCKAVLDRLTDQAHINTLATINVPRVGQ